MGGEELALPLAPGQASEIGLSFVYQNLALAGGLSVLENLTLGQRIGGGVGAWKPMNWLAEHRRAAAVLARYDVSSTSTGGRATWRRSTRRGWRSSGPPKTSAGTARAAAA